MHHVIWVRFTRKPVTCVSFRKMVPSSPMKNWPNIWQPIRKDFQRLRAAGSARWALGRSRLVEGRWLDWSCGLKAWNDVVFFFVVSFTFFCWVHCFLQFWKCKSFFAHYDTSPWKKGHQHSSHYWCIYHCDPLLLWKERCKGIMHVTWQSWEAPSW